MTVRWHWAALALAVVGAAGYGAGRLTGPSRVEVRETEKLTAWQWATDWARTEAGPVTIKTTTRERPAAPVPAGCPECPPIKETETLEVRAPVVTESRSEETTVATGERATETVTEYEAPRLTLGATVGISSFDLNPSWGAFATYRVAGPLVLFGQGEGNARGGSGRVGVGINF